MGRENNKGKLFSFDFWQKFGKTLMVVIAVMPAAGLMISLGKLIGMYSPTDSVLLQGFSRVLDTIGWGFINNMHILFATTSIKLF